jgi:hypothetical protein
MVTCETVVVSVASLKTPFAELLVRNTVSAPPVVTGLPAESSRVTVMVPEMPPAARVWGKLVITSFVAAGFAVKVAVIADPPAPLFRLEAVQGLVVPAQPLAPPVVKPLAELHPVNVDPLPAFAATV